MIIPGYNAFLRWKIIYTNMQKKVKCAKKRTGLVSVFMKGGGEVARHSMFSLAALKALLCDLCFGAAIVGTKGKMVTVSSLSVDSHSLTLLRDTAAAQPMSMPLSLLLLFSIWIEIK